MSQGCMECERRAKEDVIKAAEQEYSLKWRDDLISESKALLHMQELKLKAKDAEIKKLWDVLGYIGTVINPPYSDPVSTLEVISNKIRELIRS